MDTTNTTEVKPQTNANSIRFDDQVVIITGAGNGLGKNHALYFAERGARVIVNDLGVTTAGSVDQSNPADVVVQQITAAGGNARANYDSVTEGGRIVEQALDTYGRVDVLINNAGIIRDSSFHKMTLQDWQQVMDVHLNGAFALCHAAWPHLREQRYGRILFTLSAAGIYGNFGQANYSAAKMGMLGLMNTLAIEGKSRNIHANAIAPIVDSRMLAQFLPEEIRRQLQPALVSPLVGLLCHTDCKETGSLFEVGGGWCGKLRWQRSNGLFLENKPGVTERLAGCWSKVVNFDQVHYPADNAEAISYILNTMTGNRDD